MYNVQLYSMANYGRHNILGTSESGEFDRPARTDRAEDGGPRRLRRRTLSPSRELATARGRDSLRPIDSAITAIMYNSLRYDV